MKDCHIQVDSSIYRYMLHIPVYNEFRPINNWLVPKKHYESNEMTNYMTKTEKIIFIAGAIFGFILVYFADRILYVFLSSGPGLAVASAVLRVFGHIVLAVSFAFATSRYIRQARKDGLNKRKIVIITAWLLWPAIMVALNYANYSALRDFYLYLETTFSNTDRDFTNKIKATLPGEKKSRMTYVQAQSIYRHEGRITEYQSPAGTPISYVPDKEDLEVRRSLAFMQAHNDSLKPVMILSSVAYLLSFLGMLCFGFRSEGPTSGSSPTRAKSTRVSPARWSLCLSLLLFAGKGALCEINNYIDSIDVVYK